MKHCKKYLVIVLSILSWNAGAQPLTKDLRDALGGSKKSRDTTKAEAVTGKNYVTLLPVIAYGPANGFALGASVSLSRLFDGGHTNLSSALMNAQFTTKKQIMVNIRTKVFLDQNKWNLQGDWRFLIFTQPTYGLGLRSSTNTQNDFTVNDVGTSKHPLAEDMNFNYLRFYEDVSRKLGQTPFYLGLGIALDYHFAIDDLELNLSADSSNRYETQHYQYSTGRNFNPETYVTSGIKFLAIADTRDHIINTYKGYLLSLSARINPSLFKNSQSSTFLTYDARYFLRLSRKKFRKILAFWSTGNFTTSGNIPYLALPAIGWDTYNRSGRGYVQGRIRGINLLYNEMEYRFPVSRSGFFSGVAFINATQASSDSQKLFDGVAWGTGIGLRMLMDKRTRVNVTLDLGYGMDGSWGIYLYLQETF